MKRPFDNERLYSPNKYRKGLNPLSTAHVIEKIPLYTNNHIKDSFSSLKSNPLLSSYTTHRSFQNTPYHPSESAQREKRALESLRLDFEDWIQTPLSRFKKILDKRKDPLLTNKYTWIVSPSKMNQSCSSATVSSTSVSRQQGSSSPTSSFTDHQYKQLGSTPKTLSFIAALDSNKKKSTMTPGQDSPTKGATSPSYSSTPRLNFTHHHDNRSPLRLRQQTKFNIEEEIENIKSKIKSTLKLENKTRAALYDEIIQREEKLEREIDESLERDLREKAVKSRLAAIPFKRFPPLTNNILETIQSTLRKHRDFIVIEAFNIPLKVHDLLSLDPGHWLNDEVINFYMEMLKAKGVINTEHCTSVHIFNTFFYTTLARDGYDRVKRWTKRLNLFEMDYVIIPIHLGAHWTLGCLDMQKSRCLYFDSLHGCDRRFFSLMIEYLKLEAKDKLKKDLDVSDWRLIVPKNIPSQQNGHDCGVFMTQFAERICRLAKNEPLLTEDSERLRQEFFDFDQQHMSYLRKRLQYELINATFLK